MPRLLVRCGAGAAGLAEKSSSGGGAPKLCGRRRGVPGAVCSLKQHLPLAGRHTRAPASFLMMRGVGGVGGGQCQPRARSCDLEGRWRAWGGQQGRWPTPRTAESWWGVPGWSLAGPLVPSRAPGARRCKGTALYVGIRVRVGAGQRQSRSIFRRRCALVVLFAWDGATDAACAAFFRRQQRFCVTAALLASGHSLDSRCFGCACTMLCMQKHALAAGVPMAPWLV